MAEEVQQASDRLAGLDVAREDAPASPSGASEPAAEQQAESTSSVNVPAKFLLPVRLLACVRCTGSVSRTSSRTCVLFCKARIICV